MRTSHALATVLLRYTLTAQTRCIRTYAYDYTHICVWLCAHTHMFIRHMCIVIRIYAYSYTHIRVYVYAYIRIYIRVWCVFVIQDENFSLWFIVVKEKEYKKATSRQQKINILHKVNGDHVTNTDVASLHVHVLIGWREEAVHLPYLLLLMDQNEKKKVT